MGSKSTVKATLGFEANLWASAVSRRSMAAGRNDFVLGRIFVSIPDPFEAKHGELDAQRKQGANSDEHHAGNQKHGRSAVESMRTAGT
jgi:hypothetical protein